MIFRLDFLNGALYRKNSASSVYFLWNLCIVCHLKTMNNLKKMNKNLPIVPFLKYFRKTKIFVNSQIICFYLVVSFK